MTERRGRELLGLARSLLEFLGKAFAERLAGRLGFGGVLQVFLNVSPGFLVADPLLALSEIRRLSRSMPSIFTTISSPGW